MTDPNVFTELRKGQLVKVSNFRRVRHSTSNWFSSIRPKKWEGVGLVTNAVDAVGQVGGVLGGVAGVMAVASTALAAGGFVAIVGGPQVAIAAAVLGIGLFLKSRYSNREAAHEVISKYTWNFVDNKEPQINIFADPKNLEEAASAANTLLEDGKNQIILLGSKLKDAYENFKKVLEDIAEMYRDYERELVIAKDAIEEEQIRSRYSKMIGVIWDKETKPGGKIHQYVRRCVHTSNYLQAPIIVGMAMRYKLEAKNTHIVTPVGLAQWKFEDYFEDIEIAKESRIAFQKLSDMLKELNIV